MARQSLISWFDKHGNAVQGIGTLVTAAIALAALIGVKVQIDSSARLQQEQSARDIYREFLNLSISKPEFADPDYCAIKGGPQAAAYQNYVDYLLFTSEQMLSVSPEWEPALIDHLIPHADYICGISDWSSYPETVQSMVGRFKSRICTKTVPQCPG
ncbi:MAG: hypothetical protein RL367_1731 [Pseudomonadota bacterium]|jgi:hypothetical protein